MGGLTGTGSLVRLALRRDRAMLPVWIGVFVVVAASSAGWPGSGGGIWPRPDSAAGPPPGPIPRVSRG